MGQESTRTFSTGSQPRETHLFLIPLQGRGSYSLSPTPCLLFTSDPAAPSRSQDSTEEGSC